MIIFKFHCTHILDINVNISSVTKYTHQRITVVFRGIGIAVASLIRKADATWRFEEEHVTDLND